jgi:hypothetical protein
MEVTVAVRPAARPLFRVGRARRDVLRQCTHGLEVGRESLALIHHEAKVLFDGDRYLHEVDGSNLSRSTMMALSPSSTSPFSIGRRSSASVELAHMGNGFQMSKKLNH